MLLEVRAARIVRFWENFIKQKLKSTPDIVGAGQVRSRTSPRGPAASPSARGWSTAMVIGPMGPKLGWCVTPTPWPDCSGKCV